MRSFHYLGIIERYCLLTTIISDNYVVRFSIELYKTMKVPPIFSSWTTQIKNNLKLYTKQYSVLLLLLPKIRNDVWDLQGWVNPNTEIWLIRNDFPSRCNFSRTRAWNWMDLQKLNEEKQADTYSKITIVWTLRLSYLVRTKKVER